MIISGANRGSTVKIVYGSIPCLFVSILAMISEPSNSVTKVLRSCFSFSICHWLVALLNLVTFLYIPNRYYFWLFHLVYC